MLCRKPHVASSICLRATIFQNPEGTLSTHCVIWRVGLVLHIYSKIFLVDSSVALSSSSTSKCKPSGLFEWSAFHLFHSPFCFTVQGAFRQSMYSSLTTCCNQFCLFLLSQFVPNSASDHDSVFHLAECIRRPPLSSLDQNFYALPSPAVRDTSRPSYFP
jgi:hypothetical protein